jgi:hypothetical protein
MFKFKNFLSLSFGALLSVSFVYCENPACEVVNYVSSCEIKNDKLTETDTIVIQINDRTGERYTNVSIPYSKSQKISDLNAWIEDANGKIVRKLKNGDIINKSSISDYSLYEDDFIKTFSLKHNVYPYRIVYAYRTSFKQFITIRWDPVLHHKIPTRNAKFTLTVPKDYAFQKYYNNISDPKVDHTGDVVRYTWVTSFPKPIEDELYAVSLDKILPSLTITPMNFIYGVEGCAKDWESFGNWQFRLMQGLDELPDEEKIRVSQLINGVKDKREMIKILYHYMQDHTRYINVSIDIGGLKPYPASYVSKNKYGDCKALTNYMKALLNFAGIKSYYTLIYGGIQAPGILTQMPGPQYFNHVILTVPLGNDTIWLENTNNINPFGFVGSFIQNREGLLVDEFGSKLIHISGLNNSDVVDYRKTDIAFNKFGDASATINASFRGRDFEEFNGLNSLTNKTEQDEVIREYLTYSNFDLIRWGLSKKNRDSATIKLKLDMTFYKVLKSIGTESYFTITPIDIPAFEPPKERKLAVQLPYPIYKTDSLVYRIPEGYEIKSVPENVKISTTYGIYELSFMSAGATIGIIKRFEMPPQICSLNHYPDFYKFISSAKEADKTKIVLREKD